jgi:small subunit ribosomal protein S4
MARYKDPVCRLCRNEGIKLFLKGSRCFSTKCGIERRRYGPGQHGQTRKKQSEFAVQLREKQKVRLMFGMLERQFSLYMQAAQKQKKVPTGLKLLQLCETRLDSILYRCGLVPSRAQARQLIQHGHFLVDNKKTAIPSFILKPNQVVSVRENSQKLIKEMIANNPAPLAPTWLSVDLENLTVKIVNLPAREDLDATIKEPLIVEYYSR